MVLYKWVLTLYIFIHIFVTVSEASRCQKYDRDLNEIWAEYKKVYHKRYCSSEDRKRRAILGHAVQRINKHNLECDLGKRKFRIGLNKYSDLTHEEFVSRLNGFEGTPESRRNKSHHSGRYLPGMLSDTEFPVKLDWREKGLVTSVKDQGSCGSCWAFSSVASLESQIKKKNSDHINLSEQNLIDCSSSNGNHGCRGGLMTQAFQYIIDNGGLESESTYPYRARNSECKFRADNIAATCRDYDEIESGSEGALMKALVNVGPISTGFDGSLRSFQNYKSGIYDDPSCSSQYLDHAVLVIGYGTEDGDDYWLIKNSYGTSWGERGFAKIARNNDNQCGIATQACYPIV